MLFFFFNDTATTEIYTLSLHDALPIYGRAGEVDRLEPRPPGQQGGDAEMRARHLQDLRPVEQAAEAEPGGLVGDEIGRAHVELQSRQYLVCRLLLEKKKS